MRHKMFSIILKFLLTILIAQPSYQTEPSLIIGSFNIRTLGPTKMSNQTVVKTICKILSRYDIVAIQEIRDSKLTVIISQLVNELNDLVLNDGIVYSFVISERLGLSSTYKEQYAFIYRIQTKGHTRKIQVIKQITYDNVDKVFDRPPFIVEFKILDSNLKIKEFTLMNVHLRPSFVYSESKALKDVVDWYLKISQAVEKNISILGDYNFDCSYINSNQRNEIRSILSDFTWYIRDKYATTISISNCAYDRIIVNTKVFKNAIIPNSNMTYKYNSQFNLNTDETNNVSDHFPVELQLY